MTGYESGAGPDHDIEGRNATHLSWSWITAPSWWAALGVLVLNDHVLKAAWGHPMTGKVSDFAGVYVGAVLLGGLASSRHWRAGAWAAMATVFAAINLSPPAAHGFVELLGTFGLHWQVVVDPTDLVGLVMLAPAWRLLEDGARRQRRAPPRAMRLGAVVLGALACLGSGERAERWSTPAYLWNGTASTVEVQVRHYEGRIDCETFADLVTAADLEPAGALMRALDPAGFGEGRRFEIEPSTTLPLDQATLANAGFLGTDAEEEEEREGRSSCGVALVQMEAAAPSVVWFEGMSMVSINPEVDDLSDLEGTAPERALEIVGEPGQRGLVSHGLPLVPLLRELEAGLCEDEGLPLTWSALPTGSVELLDVTELPDGCLDLTFRNADLEPRAQICVPRTVWPFEAGTTLQVGVRGGTTVGRSWAVTFRGPGAELSLVQQQEEDAPLFDDASFALRDGACGTYRSRCGAAVVPQLLEVDGQLLRPGDFVEIAPDRMFFLSDARAILAEPQSCSPDGASTVGARYDFAVLDTLEVSP